MSFINVITIITETCIRQSTIIVENRGWSKPGECKAHATSNVIMQCV